MKPAAEATIPSADLPVGTRNIRPTLTVFSSTTGTIDPVALPLSSASPSRACRILSVLVAIVAIIVTAPVMLVVAVLVKLTSPGPIIYRQTRVGLDRRGSDPGSWRGRRGVDYGGRLFTIYKFRTMRCDTDQTIQVWAKPDDARVTPIGRVLRKYRLDELPQIFNVLKGDMNIVGPRPEQPKIFTRLRDELNAYAVRQRVLPGITGWAQVNLSYDTTMEQVRDKLRYDLEYIRNQSLLYDLRIMLSTFPVILFKKGAW